MPKTLAGRAMGGLIVLVCLTGESVDLCHRMENPLSGFLGAHMWLSKALLVFPDSGISRCCSHRAVAGHIPVT